MMVPFRKAEKPVHELEIMLISFILCTLICCGHPGEIQQALGNMEPDFRSDIDTGGNPRLRGDTVLKHCGESEIPKREGSRERNCCSRRSSRHNAGIWFCGEMRWKLRR